MKHTVDQWRMGEYAACAGHEYIVARARASMTGDAEEIDGERERQRESRIDVLCYKNRSAEHTFGPGFCKALARMADKYGVRDSLSLTYDLCEFMTEQMKVVLTPRRDETSLHYLKLRKEYRDEATNLLPYGPLGPTARQEWKGNQNYVRPSFNGYVGHTESSPLDL